MKDQGFVLFCLFVEKLELSNSHCNTLLLNQMSFFTFLLPLYLLLAGNCRSYSNTSERERESNQIDLTKPLQNEKSYLTLFSSSFVLSNPQLPLVVTDAQSNATTT